MLDVDTKAGQSGLPSFEANDDALPPTRRHRTRSGGLHLVFRHRDGLRCSTSRIALGIDVRAEGGVVWWPAAGLPVLSDAEAGPVARLAP